MPRKIISSNPDAAMRALRATGKATLPNGPSGRFTAQRQVGRVDSGSLTDAVSGAARGMSPARAALSNPFAQQANVDPAIADMAKRRTARSGSDVAWMMNKNRDPFEQFKERTYWWLGQEDEAKERKKISDWMRLIYMTHPLIPSLIDIYARFPLLELEFKHKDKKLASFYEELFLDTLDYQEFLYNMAREFWTVGEAFALGSWHDGIGAWDGDELINPDDVVVTKNRALRTHNFHIKVPAEIKKIIETQTPRAEYMALIELYPDVVNWARQDKEIPVSDVLMKQHKFTVNSWDNHGTPILMRALTTLMLEQSLNAAQDAVADRLYSPLILANLGLDQIDQDGGWLPMPEDLDQLRDELAIALQSDFRLIVHHHGLEIKNAWGREIMPNFSQDFDRIDQVLMQIFGIGADLLKGGSSGTYAAGALNRDLVENLMNTYQTGIKKFMRERMEVVAERQGHYEYETRGGMRTPVMELALLTDESTGEQYVEERPKLAIPEFVMKPLNLRDEKGEREWILQMMEKGFPVSLNSLAVNIPFEFEEELEAREDEKIELIIAEQRMLDKIFKRLYSEQLPVPAAYKDMYQEWLKNNGLATVAIDPDDPLAIPRIQTPNGEAPDEEMPTIADPAPAPNLAPNTMGDGATDSEAADMYKQKVKEQEMDEETRPAESDEKRKEMPKKKTHIASALDDNEYRAKSSYGSMKFASPGHSNIRRSKLPDGIKVFGDEVEDDVDVATDEVDDES